MSPPNDTLARAHLAGLLRNLDAGEARAFAAAVIAGDVALGPVAWVRAEQLLAAVPGIDGACARALLHEADVTGSVPVRSLCARARTRIAGVLTDDRWETRT